MWMLIRLFLILCFFPSFVFGQHKPEYAAFLIDSVLLEEAHAVVRFEESKYVITSPRVYTHYFTKAVTILDENTPEAYAIVHYDQYSDAELQDITIYDALGMMIRKVKRSEFQDMAVYSNVNFLQDERLIGFQSFGGTIPYTMEYSWRVHHRETMLYPAWRPQQLNVALEEAAFVLDAPAHISINTKTLNADFKYEERESNGRRIKSWKIHHIPAIDEEEDMPANHELFPMLFFSPEHFQVEGFTGSMKDWKSFGEFLYTLNKGKELMPAHMVPVIHAMTSACRDPKEKIDTLYYWLQKNMRYVSVQLGIGGFQSFDATYVEKNRFGDCKALSTFMKGMLQEAGIESWQVIIKGDERENLFFEDFVVNDFNHMMLHIPSEDIWLECTSNDLPAGMIHEFTQDKHVLFLTPKGGVTGKSPKTAAEKNHVWTTDTVTIGDKTRIITREMSEGNQQQSLRYLYFNKSPEEQRKFFIEQAILPVVTLDKLNISVDPKGNHTILEMKKTVAQFGTSSGNRYFLPVNAVQDLHKSCEQQHHRKSAFVSNDDYTETNDIYIGIPADYSVEYLPPSTSFEAFGNNFIQEVKIADRSIHIHQQLKNAPMHLTAEEYQQLCQFYIDMTKAMNQKIILKKSGT